MFDAQGPAMLQKAGKDDQQYQDAESGEAPFPHVDSPQEAAFPLLDPPGDLLDDAQCKTWLDLYQSTCINASRPPPAQLKDRAMTVAGLLNRNAVFEAFDLTYNRCGPTPAPYSPPNEAPDLGYRLRDMQILLGLSFSQPSGEGAADAQACKGVLKIVSDLNTERRLAGLAHFSTRGGIGMIYVGGVGCCSREMFVTVLRHALGKEGSRRGKDLAVSLADCLNQLLQAGQQLPPGNRHL